MTDDWQMPPQPGAEPLELPVLFNPPAPPPTAAQVLLASGQSALRWVRPVLALILVAIALTLGAPLPVGLAIAAGALVRP